MLPSQRLTFRDAYCSAPPLESSLRPRLSRDTEAVRPRAPLRPTKREVSESEASSVEFVLEDEDVKVKVEAPVVEQDPRQLCLRLSRRLNQAASTGSLFIGLPHASPQANSVRPVRPRGPIKGTRPTKRVEE